MRSGLIPGKLELYWSIAFVSLSHVAGFAFSATMFHLRLPVNAICTSETLILRIGATKAATLAGFRI